MKNLAANQITAELLIQIPRRFTNLWVYRNNRLNAKAVGRGGQLRHVSAGIDGQADLSGIITLSHAGKQFGVRCEIEVKATYARGKDKMSLKQCAFQERMRSMSAVYIVATSVEQCLSDIETILKENS